MFPYDILLHTRLIKTSIHKNIITIQNNFD